MKIIGVISNRDKDTSLKYTRTLIDSIIQKGGTVKTTNDVCKELGLTCPGLTEDEIIDACDIAICLGGDGTFLKAARRACKHNKPILGVNLGKLGFLTEVDKDMIENAVERVFNNKYTEEDRMMLGFTILRDGKIIAEDKALNDIVISRGAISRILHISTYINGEFVDSFPGDGLIISSPTGSTAYSMSAGGPIVEPDNDLMIITPICPHIIYSRSFITPGNRIVKVVINEDYGHNGMVTVDGQEGYEIRGGDCVEIRKSSDFVKMIKLDSKNFFKILRSKIYDRGENLE